MISQLKSLLGKSDTRIFLLLLAFVTAALFFISPDSYFNDLYRRVDSAWFYMCGKAWMNGLTPYVDFTDSKGPLLWLIYGIGYLLSRSDYTGIFWISCLWYAGTYFFAFKTAEIFLHDRRKALLCSILMTFAFFNTWFHDEIRAEDLCLLFTSLSLWRVCGMLYSETTEKWRNRSFFLLGLSFGALLMIKFNIAAMQGFIILGALWYLIREKRSIAGPFLRGMAGFAIVVLPFLILFAIKGNLGAFFHEYFYNTFHTVQGNLTTEGGLLADAKESNPLLFYLHDAGRILYKPTIGALLLLLVVGGWLASRIVEKYRFFPLMVSLAVFFLVISHHFNYYFCTCSIFLIFLCISLTNSATPRKRELAFIAAVVFGLNVGFHFMTFNRMIWFGAHNEEKRDFYTLSYLMSQVEDPLTANAVGYECGEGILAGALPAGKYWVWQNGMLPDMADGHRELLLSGKADFILVASEPLIAEHIDLTLSDLEAIGYKEYFRYDKGDRSILMSRHHDLRMPDGEIIPSRKSILLKRNPFFK